jgi:hypothetical protein
LQTDAQVGKLEVVMAGKKPSLDDEIRAIIDAHEAGVDDALKAYEQVEKRYFDAVSATTLAPTVTPATVTTPGPTLTSSNTLSN